MTRNNKRNRRFSYANSHASIQTRPNFDAQVGGVTFTARREDEFAAEIETDSSNASSLVIAMGPTTIGLSGRQARTLQRLLNKHYSSSVPISGQQPGLDL